MEGVIYGVNIPFCSVFRRLAEQYYVLYYVFSHKATYYLLDTIATTNKHTTTYPLFFWLEHTKYTLENTSARFVTELYEIQIHLCINVSG